MKMRLEKNFIDEINHENVALEANLKRDCEGQMFTIMHTGKEKKSLFGGISLAKKDGQIRIKALCKNCGKEFVLYDSATDGSKTKEAPATKYVKLAIKDRDAFKINMKYNFMKENFKTDRFEGIAIDIQDDSSKKERRIYEEL